MFLEKLRELPSVKSACAAAKISRQTAYRCRTEDPEFAEKWAAALDEAVDSLEETAYRLALKGDTNLITWLLKCHRPSVYSRPERHEHALAAKILILPAKAEGDE